MVLKCRFSLTSAFLPVVLCRGPVRHSASRREDVVQAEFKAGEERRA